VRGLWDRTVLAEQVRLPALLTASTMGGHAYQLWRGFGRRISASKPPPDKSEVLIREQGSVYHTQHTTTCP
jgi:hypothetical protein